MVKISIHPIYGLKSEGFIHFVFPYNILMLTFTISIWMLFQKIKKI